MGFLLVAGLVERDFIAIPAFFGLAGGILGMRGEKAVPRRLASALKALDRVSSWPMIGIGVIVVVGFYVFIALVIVGLIYSLF